MKDDMKRAWDGDCEEAFKGLNGKVTAAPTSAYPKYDKPIHVVHRRVGYGTKRFSALQINEGKKSSCTFPGLSEALRISTRSLS